MMSNPLYYASALVLIAILVVVHEFGHFLVARFFGIRVLVFSIGFGPRLFGWIYKGTDYRISGIPFGGYVKMAGADPFSESGWGDEEPVPEAESFMARPAWQRLLVSVAGPIFNFGLPFVVFTALYTWGEPQSIAEVGSLRAGSAAVQAGVQIDDRVVAVNGTAVRTWADVMEVLETAPHAPLDLQIERAGQPQNLQVSVEGVDATAPIDAAELGFGSTAQSARILVDDPTSPLGRAGVPTGAVIIEINGQNVRDWNDITRLSATADHLSLRWFSGELTVSQLGAISPPKGVEVQQTEVTLDPNWGSTATASDDRLWQRWGLVSSGLGIRAISEGSAAEKAGLQIGDRFLSIDGQPVSTWGDVLRLVSASATGAGEEQTARPVALVMRRQGQILEMNIQPDVIKDTDRLARYQWRPMIGVAGGGESIGPERIKRPYPLPQAFRRAVDETVSITGFIVEQLGKLLTGEASPQKSLGGPLEIFRQAAAAAEQGLFEWARNVGVFSISLGVLNLLPVPVLDGGQALMYLAEWVRGRPLPLRIREMALQAGVIFLMLLTLLVLAFDIHRRIAE